ncbi:MAG: hypothetical protein ABIF87_12710 [Pseudomonadota bacterium]|jgi:hypothetical protein
MYVKTAKGLSMLLIIAYLYWKTRDRICLWMLSYFAFLGGSVAVFRKLFPDIPFVSPTIEYMVFLVIVGIPFLTLIVLMGVEIEKRRSKKTEKPPLDFGALLALSKENIIFWAFIVLINLVAFLLE